MKKWADLIGNLHVWKRGEVRAVHKPLLTLMILARAQRGGSNELAYAEVADPLKKALREFGPSRKSYHPEFPFWYLQNDGFWRIDDCDELPRRKGKGQPTHSALMHHHAVGVVPDHLWRQLISKKNDIPTLAKALIEEFWPDTYPEDIATALGLELSPAVSKTRDPAFRDNVLVAYERRCAVCGFDGRLDDTLIGVEAAHIRWKQHDGPDVVENGLALCSLHHKVFDRGGLGLGDDLRIQVSQRLSGHDAVLETILRFNGRPLVGPQKGSPPPKIGFVKWHRKNVFKGPARAA